MIKININSLEGEFCIEIKENEDQYDLIVMMSKSDYFQENGKVWYGKTTEKQRVIAILNLIKACEENPSFPTTITINDGIITKISYGKPLNNLVLKDIDARTIEFELMKKVFELVKELIKDPILEKYMLVFRNE